MKAAARRRPNCIKKSKIRSVERGYPYHYRHSMKKCFPCTISLKSANRLLSYGQRRFLKWRPSAILNHKKIHIFGQV